MDGHENKALIWGALLIYVLVVSLIGWCNRRSKDSEDFFLAGRSLPTWLLAVTFVASWWGGGSAIDLVDVAHGTGLSSFGVYGIPVLIATALMFVFTRVIRGLGTVSQPELVLKRYDDKTSLMLTVFIVIFMTIGASIQVIVIGKFFQSFLGVSYVTGAALGTLMVLFYSMFGGFRGVVLTDLFQFVFFLFAGVFLFVYMYLGAGGFEGLEEYVVRTNNEGFLSFFDRFEDNLAYILTFGASWVIQANVWQRISAARTTSAAQKMMGLSFVVFIPLYLMVTYTGMFSAVMFDVVPEGGVVSTVLVGLDNPVLSGLLFLGLCSAIMSTMDSMLNTGALSLTMDVYKRYMRPNAKEQTIVLMGRVMTVLIAAVSLFIGTRITSVLTISWIGADFIATGAFVPIVLGMVWRRGTSAAAFCSMVFGLVFSIYNLLVALGVPKLHVPWEIASVEQAMVGMSVSLVLYAVISLLTKDDKKKADLFINLLTK